MLIFLTKVVWIFLLPFIFLPLIPELSLHSSHYGSTVLWPQTRGQLRGLKRIVILDWHQHMMAFPLPPLLWLAAVTLAHGQTIQAHRKKRGCQL